MDANTFIQQYKKKLKEERKQSKRYEILRGCCHLQRRLSNVKKTCLLCEREIGEREPVVKGRKKYFHVSCFKEMAPELEPRIDKAAKEMTEDAL